jgi:hypothetical protein
MMSTIFYKKDGKKYIPVSEYDSNLTDSLGYGDHLLSVYPGGSSRKKINPAFAPMIAAGRHSRDAISHAIMEASKLQPAHKPLTPRQQEAWENLNSELGESSHYLQYSSVHDIAGEAVDAMIKEATVLLSHPAVKNAYDEFMLVCKLVKDQNDNT